MIHIHTYNLSYIIKNSVNETAIEKEIYNKETDDYHDNQYCEWLKENDIDYNLYVNFNKEAWEIEISINIPDEEAGLLYKMKWL